MLAGRQQARSKQEASKLKSYMLLMNAQQQTVPRGKPNKSVTRPNS
jgi:hypothetical protein